MGDAENKGPDLKASGELLKVTQIQSLKAWGKPTFPQGYPEGSRLWIVSSTRSIKVWLVDGEIISKWQFPAIAGVRGEKRSVQFWQICPKRGAGGEPRWAWKQKGQRFASWGRGLIGRWQVSGTLAKETEDENKTPVPAGNGSADETEQAQRKCPHGNRFAATRGRGSPGAAGRQQCPQGDLGACGPDSSLHVSQAFLNWLSGWYKSKSWASSCKCLMWEPALMDRTRRRHPQKHQAAVPAPTCPPVTLDKPQVLPHNWGRWSNLLECFEDKEDPNMEALWEECSCLWYLFVYVLFNPMLNLSHWIFCNYRNKA